MRHRRYLAVSAVATVVLAMSVLYLADGEPADNSMPPVWEESASAPDLAGGGLDDAHAAARSFVEEYVADAGGRVIAWREHSHEREGADYVFVGYMEAENAEGGLLPSVYRAHVRQTPGGMWDPVDVQVDAAEP
jgi:hypothetical protein